MQIIRVSYRDEIFYASVLDPGSVQCLNKELGLNDPIPLDEVTVLPVVWPTKIICAALNYRDNIEKLGMKTPEEPLIFLKPSSSVAGNGEPIVIPPSSQHVEFEGELAVVIGQECRNVSPERAGDYIFGYTCANDVTARDLQKRDGLNGRAKGFDSFAPLGPWVRTQIDNVANLTIRTSLNGEVRQEGSTADMIYSPEELISFSSQIMTLFPGDVIMTGTPLGAGRIKGGDEVQVEIDEIGLLINPVVDDRRGGGDRRT